MIRKVLALLSFVIGLFLLVIIFRTKREYDCLSPEEIAKCKKYQIEIDKLYNESWSWQP